MQRRRRGNTIFQKVRRAWRDGADADWGDDDNLCCRVDCILDLGTEGCELLLPCRLVLDTSELPCKKRKG